jgi:YbbR domain-containing protein
MHRRRRTFAEWFKERALLQIFSLVIALAAWALVNSGQTISQRKTVHLQYVQVPASLVFQRNPLKEVKVDLTGSLYRLRSISDADLNYTVDLSSAKPGTSHIEMDIENLRLPLDVEASHISPRSFNIYLEEIYARSLPIKPLFIGKLKDGFQMGIVKVSPQAVSVSGPKSIVSKLAEVGVDVSLANRELSFSETIKPKLSFPGAEALENVTVEVEITPQKTRLEFPTIPVSTRTLQKVKITPMNGKVILEGPEAEIRGLESKLEIVISVEGLKRGRYRLRGNVLTPDKVKLISIEPESFLVEVLQEGGHK